MVSITILAIISSIGLVTYGKAQVTARDDKRKTDLRLIASALNLYYQEYHRYPRPNGLKAISDGTGDWLHDDGAAIPNTPELPPGLSVPATTPHSFAAAFYNDKEPNDPKQNNNDVDNVVGNGYVYETGLCKNGGVIPNNGQWFKLEAGLENSQDKDINYQVTGKDCDPDESPDSDYCGDAYQTNKNLYCIYSYGIFHN